MFNAYQLSVFSTHFIFNISVINTKPNTHIHKQTILFGGEYQLNVFNSITIRLYICSYHKKSPMSNRMKTILGGGLFSPDVQKVYEEREKK